MQMMRAVLSVATLFFLVAGIEGCDRSGDASDGPSQPGEPRTAQNDEAKAELAAILANPVLVDRAEAVSTEDVAAVVTANNTFAGRFFATLPADENVVFSAHSISSALNLTLAGARGQTRDEIRSALSITLEESAQHAAVYTLDYRMMVDGSDVELPVTLRTANRVWFDSSYEARIPDPFRAIANDYYFAGFETLDFTGDSEASRVAINDWVSDQTAARIPNLLPPPVITPATRFVLTNAVYFLADWKKQFELTSTREEPFYLNDGSEVTAPLMNQVDVFGYAATDTYQIIALPYEGEAFSMVVVLPRAEQYQAVADAIGEGLLERAGDNLRTTEVQLTLPRFTMRWSGSLVTSLQALGMGRPFSPQADFGGLSGPTDEPLFISDVIHEAFIQVDESGTEAAAATAVVMLTQSVPNYQTMRVDRPFFFAIRHNETGALLFHGRVLNPVQ